jgi:hypothetical protein
MEIKDKNYLYLILLHVAIGFLVYLVPFLATIYGFAILFISLYYIHKTKNKNNEVLYAAAYIVGSEIFLRMTDGSPSYEFGKYGVIIFMLIGMFYSGFSKNAVPYWIFTLLLIPSIVIATSVLTNEPRKTIMFNISGPLCLAFSAMYTYMRKIKITEVNNILLTMALPIVTTSAYLLVYTPNFKEITFTTGSNSLLTGGFGPNQVATIFGLGMFIFFSRLMLNSKTLLIVIINLICASYISFRGILSFSRGGMLTGFIMIIVFIYFVFINLKQKGRFQLMYLSGFLIITLASVWFYTSFQTNGLIEKRYRNENALGVAKKSNFSGREDIAKLEYNMFLENPIFGVGVGRGAELRLEIQGEFSASHDEITRMLAEHGTLGIIAFIILFFTPLALYFDNKQHIYFLAFFLFWLLTINHAAMRTASPSFIYALALLKVTFPNNQNQNNEIS